MSHNRIWSLFENSARSELEGATAVPAIVILGEAENGRDAVIRVEKLQHDVILMDLVRPGMDGREAIRQVYSGESSLHPVIARKALEELSHPSERQPTPDPLTSQEVAVL